jgi:hypothetical protein
MSSGNHSKSGECEILAQKEKKLFDGGKMLGRFPNPPLKSSERQ